MAIPKDSQLLPLAPKKSRRILLFPAPLQGHISPMLQLANILHSQGFSITIIHTNFNSPDFSNYPQFTFVSIDDALPDSIKNSTPNTLDLPILTGNCVEPFQHCLSQLLNENKGSDEPIACLIADVIWSYTSVVVDTFKLPMILLSTVSMATSLFEIALPIFRRKGYFDLIDHGSQLEASVPEFPALKFKDIPRILAHNPMALGEILSIIVTEMKVASSGIIWNACKELEKPVVPEIYKDFPINNFIIGPIHKYFPSFSSSLIPQDTSTIPWLNSQAPNSVIYVSFGSQTVISEAEFLEMAWGLYHSMQPFLWVVTPGLVYGSEWLPFELLPNAFMEKLGGRGHIVKWAPQQEVLAHPATGAFFTHTGWNSTMESIGEGVPMICYYGYVDQPINARYVCDVWRVGVGLENGLEREEINRAIRRLMVEKEGEEIRERIVHLKETINECVKQGGSSHESVESLVDYILKLDVKTKG